MNNFNGQIGLERAFCKGIGLSTIIGVAAIPIAKVSIWCGRKIMQIADNQEKSSCKKIALKIAATILYTFGVLAAITAAVGVGLGATVITASVFGLAGSMVAGPYGLMFGFSGGALVGAVAAGGLIGVFLSNLCETGEPVQEI